MPTEYPPKWCVRCGGTGSVVCIVSWFHLSGDQSSGLTPLPFYVVVLFQTIEIAGDMLQKFAGGPIGV